jgi:hypothetical protein
MNTSEIQDELKTYYNINTTIEDIEKILQSKEIKNLNEIDDDFIIFYIIYNYNLLIINDKTKLYIDKYYSEHNELDKLIITYKAFTNLALDCNDYEIFCKKLDYE